MDTAAVMRKKEEILKIAVKHGARNVRIFGSVARGEPRSDSDVDFLVDMEPSRQLGVRIALCVIAACGKGEHGCPNQGWSLILYRVRPKVKVLEAAFSP